MVIGLTGIHARFPKQLLDVSKSNDSLFILINILSTQYAELAKEKCTRIRNISACVEKGIVCIFSGKAVHCKNTLCVKDLDNNMEKAILARL